MERQDSITLEGITNFLEAGALLRHRNQWILIEGPFSPVSDPNSVEISVFCPDFYEPEKGTLWAGKACYEFSSEEMRGLCERYLAQSPPVEDPLASASWAEPAKDEFAQAFRTIQSRIFSNEIHKAVPVVFARAAQTVSRRDRCQLILNLLLAPATLYVYGFWQEQEGLLGATPEILFNYQQGLLQTMALAGTCPKAESVERGSLLKDAKEMQEHQLVVDDIQALLGQWGLVEKRGPYILELPTLLHLRTDLQVHCKSRPDYVSVAQNLHPTPALGVAPRSAGFKWMRQLPGQEERRRFGAPFAFIRREEALCLVAIRNLQWNRDSAMIGSGCGVVAASELDREWRELFQKRSSVIKIMGL